MTGKAQLTVPPGTQTHKVFRLRGQGLPHLRGSGRGDQYVRVILETPRVLSAEQKDLMQRLMDLERGEGAKGKHGAGGFFNRKKDAK